MAKKGSIQASILNGAATLGVAPGATITIRDPGGGLSTLWQDRDAAVGQANPFTADADGHFLVYATPGRFKVTAVVGAESQVFEDVIVKARAAPQLLTELLSISADGTPQQTVTLIGIANGVQVALDAVLLDRTPANLLTANAADIAIVAGSPGWARVDFMAELKVLDAGAPPSANDTVEAAALIRQGGSPIAGSQASTLFRVQPANDVFSLTGYAMVDIVDATANTIELFVYLISESLGSLEIDILATNTKLTVTRYVDEIS